MQYFPAGRTPHVSNDNVAHVLLPLRPTWGPAGIVVPTMHGGAAVRGGNEARVHAPCRVPHAHGNKRTVDSPSIHKYI